MTAYFNSAKFPTLWDSFFIIIMTVNVFPVQETDMSHVHCFRTDRPPTRHQSPAFYFFFNSLDFSEL